jgi:hypothetical protein
MMTTQIDAAADFVWCNARLLDRRRFAHHFLGESADPVVGTLRLYQNADGGFGNALEPDIRAPISQPQPVEVALHVLDALGLPDVFQDQMVTRACDWLLTVTTEEGGVPFVLTSAQLYPSAPWWKTSEDTPASHNPTAAIAGLLHRHGVDHPWLGPATEFSWRAIDRLREPGGYDILPVLHFLDNVPDRERASAAFERVARLVEQGGLVALDPDDPAEVFKPLDYARRPDSIARPLFTDDQVQAHLDGLVKRQQPDGGWPITWHPPSPAAECEWRGWVTVEALLTLRAYGRL